MKDQKKEIKKKISETINNNIPILRPDFTLLECHPSSKDSLEIFSHQYIEIVNTIKTLTNTYKNNFLWNINSKDNTIFNAPIELNKGHGLTGIK